MKTQCILTEQEYKDLKERADKLEEIKKYLLSTIISNKPKPLYKVDSNGIFRRELSPCIELNNFNFVILFELLDIAVDGCISLTYSKND
jgi:hypothetical protein